MRKLSVVLIVSFSFNAFIVSAQSLRSSALPEVIVYKTKKDYRNLVPVVLSADRRSIVSYPGPGDLKAGNEYAIPVVLHKGYLLDKRGVGWNTAFLKLTYEEYGKLIDVPSEEELYKMIVDKNPMTALYDCGKKASVHSLNNAIDKKRLGKICKTIADEQPAGK